MPIIRDNQGTRLISVDESANPVFVSVRSLFGRQAAISVKIEEQRHGPFGGVDRLLLGTNKDLPGQQLLISASVRVTDGQSRSSGLEISFDGIPDFDQRTLFLIPEPGVGIIDFLVTVFFSRQ